MTILELQPETLETLRQRRAAGERVSTLAREVGCPWQKLDKALRHLPAEALPDGLIQPRNTVGPWTERYRPMRLSSLLGQPQARKILERFVAQPRPMAFLFEGETGTGKTSAALALAAELGCLVEQAEFGGVWTIASGEQSADAVRQTCSHLAMSPLVGSGWKVLIVNEADRMNPAAETIWLDRLENLPPKSVVIFTTNFATRLSERFRDRCLKVSFTASAEALTADARLLAVGIWRRETGQVPAPEFLDSILKASTVGGQLSLRRIVQNLETASLEGGAL